MSGGKIGPEVVERMAAFVRSMADKPIDDRFMGYDAAEARSIAALLPEPVDPDVLVVREVLHAHQRAMTPPDSGWGNMSYRNGSYDKRATFQAALAAYRVAKQDAGK